MADEEKKPTKESMFQDLLLELQVANETLGKIDSSSSVLTKSTKELIEFTKIGNMAQSGLDRKSTRLNSSHT